MANAKKETKNETKSFKKVVYDPVFDTATTIKIFDLSKKTKEVSEGKEFWKKTPLIEGLPIDLIVEKEKPIELTIDQYNELKKIGFIETKKERDERCKESQKFSHDGERRQYGVDPELAYLFEYRNLYNDVLIDCD